MSVLIQKATRVASSCGEVAQSIWMTLGHRWSHIDPVNTSIEVAGQARDIRRNARITGAADHQLGSDLSQVDEDSL